MKNYTITVNGNVYNVTVEEGTTAGVVQNAAPVAAAPVAPKAAPAAPAASAGAVEIVAGAAGKILRMETAVGATVARGDNVLILEAMKMEIPVVAPEDGTIAGFNVSVGDTVEAGQVLATMN